MTDQPEVLSTAGDRKAEADTAHGAFLEHRRRNRTTRLVRSVCRCGAFASDWVLSPEIAVQAGLDHTRRARAGGPP